MNFSLAYSPKRGVEKIQNFFAYLEPLYVNVHNIVKSYGYTEHEIKNRVKELKQLPINVVPVNWLVHNDLPAGEQYRGDDDEHALIIRKRVVPEWRISCSQWHKDHLVVSGYKLTGTMKSNLDQWFREGTLAMVHSDGFIKSLKYREVKRFITQTQRDLTSLEMNAKDLRERVERIVVNNWERK